MNHANNLLRFQTVSCPQKAYVCSPAARWGKEIHSMKFAKPLAKPKAEAIFLVAKMLLVSDYQLIWVISLQLISFFKTSPSKGGEKLVPHMQIRGFNLTTSIPFNLYHTVDGRKKKSCTSWDVENDGIN